MKKMDYLFKTFKFQPSNFKREDPDLHGWVLKVQEHFDFHATTYYNRLKIVILHMEIDAYKWFGG